MEAAIENQKSIFIHRINNFWWCVTFFFFDKNCTTGVAEWARYDSSGLGLELKQGSVCKCIFTNVQLFWIQY